jgi:hypothetical protein
MNLAFSTRLPRIGSLAAVALVVVGMAASANAGLVTFQIANETTGTAGSPVNGVTGGSGSFDVTVSQPGGPNLLAQYNLDINLQPGATGIQFTGASITGTTAPYVFTGNSDESGNSSPFFDATEASNSDAVVSNPGPTLSATLEAMMNVTFTVPAGTPAGTYPIVFNQDDPTVDPFADWVNTISNADAGNFLPGSTINGSIIVTTPEPASVAMLLMGAIGLIGIGVRRARRA